MSCIILFCNSMHGQLVNDTILLKEVDIVEKRKLKGIGINITEINKMYLKKCEQSNLSTLLNECSPLFIKSYYPGGISTSSVRGVSASHVQVLWNGMKLNSPMLGQVDFSGVPVSITDDVRIYHGSGNIAESSGALGGSIHLNSQANWSNKLQLSVISAYGSFNTHNDQVNIAIGNGKIQSKTNLYLSYSDNNFTYKDYTLPDLPKKRNQYAEYSQKGFQQELYFRLKKRNVFSLKTWAQIQDRNIAPVIGTDQTLTPENNEQQHDNSITTILDWDHFTTKHIFNLKLGILYNDLNYINKILGLNTKNHMLTNTQKLTYKYKANKNLVINAMAGNDYILVRSMNYSEKRKRNHSSITINSEIIFDHIQITAGNRSEFIENQKHPLTPSIGFDLTPAFISGFCLSGSYSENMHYPTLNDQFWNPGGNQDLLPEKNKSVEIGIKHKYRKVNHSVTVYSSNINNLIMWLPGKNNIWSAINIRKVHARGIELHQSIHKVKINKILSNFDILYNYTVSTNENQISDQDLSYKKQLIYIPKNQLKINTNLIYKKNSVHITYIYNSRRYISTDNLYYIPEHYLTNVSFDRAFKLSRISLNISFSINNLLDQSYIAVAGYPMPGRNYTITLKCKFAK